MTTKAQAIVAQLQRELARRELLDFCKLVYPGFQTAPHLELIARHIEQVDAGKLKRLAVLLPPRHGKSVLASQLATAWLLGRDPTRDIIMATHSDELSNRNSRVTRDTLKDPSWPFECSLRPDSFSVGRWNLVEGGGLWACGSDSSITGRGADVLILDDLQHDSGTAGERAAAWRWYREIATPRLNNNAAIIAIGTRFDEEDLFGRILAGPDASDWTVLRMPAIAEADDILGREVGEALWPEHVSLSELWSRKQSMGTVWFESQFQQNPIPAEGTMFKKAWFQNRYTALPTEFDKVTMGVDSASKTKQTNDYSAICVIGTAKNTHYLLHSERRRCEFPDLLRWITSAYETWRPTHLCIEDSANAVGIIQILKRDSLLPVKAVQAKGSKEYRLQALTGICESGRVLLPDESPWLVEFERELFSFPNGRFDDQCDAWEIALSQCKADTGLNWGKLNTSGPASYTISRGPL